jgi:hypothetical protein
VLYDDGAVMRASEGNTDLMDRLQYYGDWGQGQHTEHLMTISRDL